MGALILTAITSVFLHGRIIQPGTEFACDMEHAKKLVKGGSARLKSTGISENTDGNGEKTPDLNVDLTKKLDNITVPKLKEMAQKYEITLSSDDNKPQIIEKIIAAGVKFDEENV